MVHQTISMMKWIRSSRLSIKNYFLYRGTDFSPKLNPRVWGWAQGVGGCGGAGQHEDGGVRGEGGGGECRVQGAGWYQGHRRAKEAGHERGLLPLELLLPVRRHHLRRLVFGEMSFNLKLSSDFFVIEFQFQTFWQ